jgi:predicted nucleotidyltransferase
VTEGQAVSPTDPRRAPQPIRMPGLEETARKHGIRLVLEFGSAVSGRQHPRSDLDIAVLLERPTGSPSEILEITADLQVLFPGQEIDLAVINRADPLFLKQIAEGCRLLYGSPGDLAALRMYAFRRYQDHRRYLALERQYVVRMLARLAGP